MGNHKLKCETKYFQDWQKGDKTFEVRKDDRRVTALYAIDCRTAAELAEQLKVVPQ